MCFRSLLLCALLVASLSPNALAQVDGEDEQSPSSQYLRNEVGFHFGSPLKLSTHFSHIFPWARDTEQQIEGPEILVEVGLGGVRGGLGWGYRAATYYNGWSVGLNYIRTFESFDDPLAYSPNHDLVSLSWRGVGIMGSVRAEVIYDLSVDRDRWGIGWSFGFAW